MSSSEEDEGTLFSSFSKLIDTGFCFIFKFYKSMLMSISLFIIDVEIKKQSEVDKYIIHDARGIVVHQDMVRK